MAGIHKLVKSEEHVGNYPQFRHFRECSCGHQIRAAREELADSQFVAHQNYHGYVEPTEEENNEPKNTQEIEKLKQLEPNKLEEKKPENPGTSGNGSPLDKLAGLGSKAPTQ